MIQATPVAGKGQSHGVERKARWLHALQTDSSFADEVRVGQLEVSAGLPRV